MALNVIALVLLALQIMGYASMEGKPDYMYFTPVLSDSQSIAQWIGAFVGFNFFGLLGVGLLLFANTRKRRGTSNAQKAESAQEEALAEVPDPADDKDIVWEELRHWPKNSEEDGAKE